MAPVAMSEILQSSGWFSARVGRMSYKRILQNQVAYLAAEQPAPRRRLRLHDFPMWNNMTAAEMASLLDIVVIKGYTRGETLFTPFEEPNRLYLLQLGRVKTYMLTADGRQKILHIFAPGDAFGALLLGAVDGRLPWAEALGDVIVCSMDEAGFRDLMMRCPNMCLDLFQYVSQIHVEAMRRLQGLLHTPAERRVVITLLELGRLLGHADKGTFTISPHFTHEDIADLIGVVRTTVTQLITKLRRRNIVSRSGRKLIVHRAAAERYLEGPGLADEHTS